jgi:hypothetical protein
MAGRFTWRAEIDYLQAMKPSSQFRKILSRLFAPVSVEVLRCVPRRGLAGEGLDGGEVILFFRR